MADIKTLTVKLSVKRRWFFTPLLCISVALARVGFIGVETAQRAVRKGLAVHVG